MLRPNFLVMAGVALITGIIIIRSCFSFPVEDKDTKSLFLRGKCPKHEIPYMDPNSKTNYTCDCGPGFIYYKLTDSCYLPYHQGPCKEKQILILEKVKGERETKCVRNPCQEGFAKYKGTCYELSKPNGPCKPISEGGGIFDVNSTTLELGCLVGPDTLSLIGSTTMGCPPGSRRDYNNQCRQEF